MSDMLIDEFHNDDIEYFFVEREGGRLFVSHHNPAKATGRPAVIVLNPIFEERSRAHRYLYNWSRYLAFHGHPVVRFDYLGQGDSEGDMSDMSLESQLEDLRVVYGWTEDRKLSDRIAFHGLRWGASLAGLAAEQDWAEVDHVVQWEPIVNGEAYLQRELRKNLASQLIVHQRVLVNRKELVSRLESGEAVNIDGYLFSSKFWEGMKNFDLEGCQFRCPALRYEFLAPRKGKAAEPTVGVTEEVRPDSTTCLKSTVPRIYLEIPQYTNYDHELFMHTLRWVQSLD